MEEGGGGKSILECRESVATTMVSVLRQSCWATEKGNDEDAISMLEKSSFCSSVGQGGEEGQEEEEEGKNGMRSMYDEVKEMVETDGEMRKWVYEDGKVMTLMHDAAWYDVI